MLLVKNRLIFGAIKTVFGAIFKTIYGILGLFSLQPLVFCAVAGALLEIAFRAVSGSDAGFILFHLILCLCVLYAVLRTVYRLLGLGRKKIKRRERAQILSDFEEREERDNVSPPARSPLPEHCSDTSPITSIWPSDITRLPPSAPSISTPASCRPPSSTTPLSL